MTTEGEETFQGWLTRDLDGALYLAFDMYEEVELPKKCFPEVEYGGLPTEVEIRVRLKEE